MAQSLGYNDAVLFLSLLYSSVDLQLEWETFSACARPVHYWLLVSYACVLGLRLAQIIGTRSTEALPGGGAAAHFLLQLRHKSATSRLLSRLVWLAAVPFFSCWTVLGTSWLWAARAETPQCMPTATHYWFAVFWLALCYIWISIHVVIGTVAATLEWRVRRAEGDLREIEDADVVSRWGRVSELTMLPGPAGRRGLGAGALGDPRAAGGGGACRGRGPRRRSAASWSARFASRASSQATSYAACLGAATPSTGLASTCGCCAAPTARSASAACAVTAARPAHDVRERARCGPRLSHSRHSLFGLGVHAALPRPHPRPCPTHPGSSSCSCCCSTSAPSSSWKHSMFSARCS
ncbi:unnamed protein product [Prorocentrum cordatum]|uniref:Uncharacterized protein n=1 Tax=Prorocentrum cordatum TaxID=2364126 RepID=A0ABN9S612_9DINO|nr:unnamed protein product [Polarella glacialis]